ncbi:glycoside hydrolase family 130 protein [Pedobacter sandarakinus]|uniref:glycoside hydrolase family 130 protein n=1 Tax=Pedobacter sandarakinus TaxID=353156 RepID=UPI002246C277|nr:glycoside hydrolase family 130 protein [Pedobacter sandarakinus]MCX2573080.1 glycoside hydrolase family 130 protein [Pedobacter sandarakinus]
MERFPQNPILSPQDLVPSRPGLEIACLLNPGVFVFQAKTWLLIRVAERPRQKTGMISFPILKGDGIEVIEIAENDPDLIADDPRVINYKGADYLTTLSHFRLVCSDDGINFYQPDDYPLLHGQGLNEVFGIEDCRVAWIADTYYLTYTAVSAHGVGVGMRTTKDWKTFEHHGMIIPPHNKDCAIFEQRINGKFFALHRPSSVGLGGNYIWIAESPDGIHWGNHRCLIKTRVDKWDSKRVGAGAAPIKTSMGWLAIYHGANAQHEYCLGAFLMDLEEPSKVLAQTDEPIMRPTAKYEKCGFFGNVVFTNGHTVNADELIIYYGAADEFVCGAKYSIKEILSQLVPVA